MPAYKYTTQKGIKWLAKFYYIDAEGKRQQKLKRGFNRRSDALEYERGFLTQTDLPDTACSLPWNDFIDQYFKDKTPALAKSTLQTKHYTFNNHIRDAFNCPISEVTTAMIDKWSNSLLPNYSLRHCKKIYTEMRALFNHAERVYNLNPNPVKKTSAPAKREQKKEMQFWTYDEYRSVINCVDDIKARTAICFIYWTGIRKGELLALTWGDITGSKATINKSLQRIRGESIITPPKNISSDRIILLPDRVLKQLDEWKKKQYKPRNEDHIFEWEKRFIEQGIQKGCEQSGVKKIRVHDLRHSHVSYLISKGCNIKLIANRLGHKNVSMTLNTYSHMYPSDEQNLVDVINNEK